MLDTESSPPCVALTYTVLLLKAAYWCHAHTINWEQVARELYGPLIVQGRDDIEVDQELVLILYEW